MNKITIVLILSSFCGLTYEFALAPATVGGIASSAGRLSNHIKVSLTDFILTKKFPRQCLAQYPIPIPNK